ncbi:hypothetical protein HELRODRAFT_184059 [Helobdella robusta]|uniref:FLYWCH-type domain-containing protein n=1 Tax=Helobdella robusta TaxID=6412 RepID=T1FKI2_HELRO|nr:hypothetical protein HELRODRAFT_184059 [Helobdella robusta]ESO08300.1 hypothetical protein HELRODRAFT_184059 [Helobdella robusta]
MEELEPFTCAYCDLSERQRIIIQNPNKFRNNLTWIRMKKLSISKSCMSARLHTRNDEIVKRVCEHNHAGNAAREDFPVEAQPVLDNLEDTWIGRPNRCQQRKSPRFSYDLWNCYNAALNGLPKTNNSCEEWHRAFNELIGASHPTIWKFISSLKDEQASNEGKIEQYVAGAKPPPSKKELELLLVGSSTWDMFLAVQSYNLDDNKNKRRRRIRFHRIQGLFSLGLSVSRSAFALPWPVFTGPSSLVGFRTTNTKQQESPMPMSIESHTKSTFENLRRFRKPETRIGTDYSKLPSQPSADSLPFF